MTISALAALMVWDALALEPRDAAILGPLPIAARTITRAKLAAALIFGAFTSVALNAAPSVLYPALLTVNVRGIRGATLLQLIAVHAMTVMLAGLLGFFAVLAVRGTLRTLLGEMTFRRVSSGVQSALVVAAITALLLAPTVRARDVRDWVAHGSAPAWPIDPVLWYLGANETLAGRQLAETPIVLPPRVSSAGVPTGADPSARAAYRALLPRFAVLAVRAWLLLPAVVMVALATFLWTNRRLPDRTGDPPTPSRVRTGVRRLVERYTQDEPEMEAGFFFALQTLMRSAPHRTIVAAGCALGVTHALVVLTQSRGASSIASAAPLFAISTGLLISLLVGVRYAVTVPAAPGANWTIRMAWHGDERPFLMGVKRAALIPAALILLVFLPVHIAFLGITAALIHSGLGMLFAIVSLEVLFLSYRKMPFACSYVPVENPKFVWPAGVVMLLFVTYGFANLEWWAMEAAPRAIGFGLVLGSAGLLLTRCDRSRRRERRTIAFDERPALPTQRLGLSEQILGNE